MTRANFESPFAVVAPPGAAEWESLYNWYHLFSEDRRETDENRFWFQDKLHHPQALHPYDEIFSECWWHALGAFNTRIFALPPAFGVDQRILNGYLYCSPVPVTDPEMIAARAEIYSKRAGYYYQNWDEIYAQWKVKTTDRFTELKQFSFAPLPELEDDSIVFEHNGISSGHRLIANFNRMITIMYETFQWHFELLNIGYAAYLTFFQFCREAFPKITDATISRMVGGLHVDLYRPDDELKRLAKKAEELNISALIMTGEDREAIFTTLGNDKKGKLWVADWKEISDPWFLVATDPGHPGGYHVYKTWLEDQDIPLAHVKEYIKQLQNGETIDRPTKKILAERDRITHEYTALLNEEDQIGFTAMVDLARKVFVYIEEHMIYIDHWIWSTFWRKSRELARSMAAMGYFETAEDMFFLRRYEVMEALYDLVAGWSVGAESRGKGYWQPIIEKRKVIYEKLKEWTPPPALGVPPEQVTEPFTVMLWGITTEKVAEWLLSDEVGSPAIQGVAGAPGVVEGTVRIIHHISQLDQLQEGEILVCPATSPSWSPVFTRIAGVISDAGGIMSHTAIVCREYGLPAVVGTGDAVSRLHNGQRIRLDGHLGVITILE